MSWVCQISTLSSSDYNLVLLCYSKLIGQVRTTPFDKYNIYHNLSSMLKWLIDFPSRFPASVLLVMIYFVEGFLFYFVTFGSALSPMFGEQIRVFTKLIMLMVLVGRSLSMSIDRVKWHYDETVHELSLPSLPPSLPPFLNAPYWQEIHHNHACDS